jgi:hypothetical protein
LFQVCVGGRDGIFMVMEYVEHDLKYVTELQKAKKVRGNNDSHA